MSRTNFHGPKDVRAIEVRLYLLDILVAQMSKEKVGAYVWLNSNLKSASENDGLEIYADSADSVFAQSVIGLRCPLIEQLDAAHPLDTDPTKKCSPSKWQKK